MPTSQRRSLTPYDDRLVQALAAVSAAVAALAPGMATGNRPVDALLQAALAALVTLAGGRARRWAVLWMAAVATASAAGWTYGPAVAALVLALALAARRERLRLVGALSAGLAVQSLLWQDAYLFHGASVLVGAVAVVPIMVSAHRRTRGRIRRRNQTAVLVLTGLVAVVVVAAAVAALLAAPHLQDGSSESKEALASARRGDTASAQDRLDRAEQAFRDARAYTDAWWLQPARVVPLVAQHVQAMQEVTDQGVALAATGTSVARVGDYQDLRYESGALDLQRLRDLAGPLGRADDVLGTARSRLADLDRSWLVGPFNDRLTDLTDEVDRASGEASVASQAVREAPGLLGGAGPRTYFVAFVNPAEERGGGGFLGNFGILTAVDGKLQLTRSGPIRELIEARPPGQRTLDGPREYLSRYGQYQPADFLQDATFSPNFPYTAEVISQLYPQSGGTPVDGVISLDPYALAALLQFTGPIDVPGYDQPLTSENAADVILRQQYLTFGDEDNSLRKDLLVEASRITFDRLTSGNLPGPEKLVDVLGPMVHQRRLQLAAEKPSEQALFETIGADGKLSAPRGHDVLMVSHQNFGNNKIDAYLHRTVTYDSTVDAATGEVASTATITLRNDAPAEGLPKIVIANLRDRPPGTNVMLFSVYSTLNLAGAKMDGVDLALVRGREVGLSVYTAQIDVAPGTTRTITVSLKGGVDLSDGTYHLSVVPQAMVNPDQITVRTHFDGPVTLGPVREARSTDASTLAATAPPAEPLAVEAQLDPA